MTDIGRRKRGLRRAALAAVPGLPSLPVGETYTLPVMPAVPAAAWDVPVAGAPFATVR